MSVDEQDADSIPTTKASLGHDPEEELEEQQDVHINEATSTNTSSFTIR